MTSKNKATDDISFFAKNYELASIISNMVTACDEFQKNDIVKIMIIIRTLLFLISGSYWLVAILTQMV